MDMRTYTDTKTSNIRQTHVNMKKDEHIQKCGETRDKDNCYVKCRQTYGAKYNPNENRQFYTLYMIILKII